MQNTRKAAPVSDAARGLKKIREETGLTVRKLADLIGWPHSTYSTYEDRYKRKFLPMELVNALVPVLNRYGIDRSRLLVLAGVGVNHENVNDAADDILQPTENGGTLHRLHHREGPSEIRLQPPNVSPAQVIGLDSGAFGPEDIPVRGVVRGGQGGGFELNMGGEALEYRRRPVSLIGKGKIYALHVDGDSMAPRYEPGEIILVWEQKPPLIGRDVVVQLHPTRDGDNPPAYLKRLVKRNSREVVLAQFNPPKTVTVKASEILSIHLVLTRDEMI